MGIPPAEYALTQLNVHWTYLRLIMLPVSQNADYDYAIAGTLFELPTIVSFVGYIGLWTGIVLLAKKRPLASFPVLWFLVALLPISFVVTVMDLRLGDVIFEHRAYLPSVAFFPAFVAGILYTTEKLRCKKIFIVTVAICITVVISLSIATYERNKVWRTELSLWTDVVSKSPKKARTHTNIGNAYLAEGLADKAIEHYQTALGLPPDISEPVGDYNYAKIHYNLGKAYGAKGLKDKAMEHYKTAINLNPRNPRPHFNIGVIYLERGFVDKARAEFETALRLNPYDGEATRFLKYISQLEKQR
jgi:tetratricopeptide (TPR) repeat protein